MSCSYMVRYYIHHVDEYSKWYNAEPYQIPLIEKFLENETSQQSHETNNIIDYEIFNS